jgi:hypothetical protein
VSGVVFVVGVVVLSLPGGETEMTGQRPSEMSELCGSAESDVED